MVKLFDVVAFIFMAISVAWMIYAMITLYRIEKRNEK